MRRASILGLAFAAMLGCASAPRYPTYQSGELAGFSQSPAEHIIVSLESVLHVPRLEGRVYMDGSTDGLADALFEVRRGPAGAPVHRTRTTRDGTFELRGLPSGRYLFKVTLLGFKSVVGEVVVSTSAPTGALIVIPMQVGG